MLNGKELKFYKPKLKGMKIGLDLAAEVMVPELEKDEFKINMLPSCARVCFNLILLPDNGGAVKETKGCVPKSLLKSPKWKFLKAGT
jgi:hypothetical protein